ncbi:hypothetical protein K438DRAFT_1978871 [Mycena galopus ATCC 62051]|nr:hypothetical protein K438DRAFT_1978871 [Mycena galopus ATCC 62051]
MPHGIVFTCPEPGCDRHFSRIRDLSRHRNSAHRKFMPASDSEDENTFKSHFHPLANALPCNADGEYLPPFTPPVPPPAPPEDGLDPAAWTPFASRIEFAFADFHFSRAQSSVAEINTALDLWAASVMGTDRSTPWNNAADLYTDIDRIQEGDAPWRTHIVRYSGPLPPGTPLRWMTQPYEVCMRDLRKVLHNQLAIRSFKEHVDYVPYRQFNHAGKRAWSNLMSGDWAWKQATEITCNPDNHGCAFVPVIAGSDKTTVSVATGHQEYHPVYASLGILSGPAHRAHGNGVLPVTFLAIPKVSKKHRSKPEYQRFCRQMYHTSLALVFEPLKQYMDTPDIVMCPDGHYRHVIYSIGPYIADYPEQVWLAAIVQNWCPKCDAHPDRLDAAGARLRNKTKTEVLIDCFDPGILWDDYGLRSDIVPFTNEFLHADIHELLSVDLLHQLIKGTFKDHLVTWVNEYLHLTYGEKRALEIIQDIDHRISAVPDKLARFHQYCAAFIDCGLRTDISLPRQHSLIHYTPSIILFGSPNGLCSSITESKHIKAVKEPWRRSSRYKALAQMLVTLTRLDKLAALRMTLKLLGMLVGTVSSYTRGVLDGEQPQLAAAAPAPDDEDDDNDDGTVHGPKSLSDIELAHTLQRGYPHTLLELAAHIHHLQLPVHLRRFLHEELHGPPDPNLPPIHINNCPEFDTRIDVHHSAIALFYTPSELGGRGGMYREHIRSNPN